MYYMITSANIMIHLLTRKKVCSFFIWLGFQKLSPHEAGSFPFLHHNGRRNTTISLLASLLFFKFLLSPFSYLRHNYKMMRQKYKPICDIIINSWRFGATKL